MSSTNSNKNNNKSSTEDPFDALKDERTGDQTASFFNMYQFFMNLNDKHASETRKDKNLSYVERINHMFSEMNNIDGLESLTGLHKGSIFGSMKNLLFEMAKKIDEYEKKDEIQTDSMEKMQDTAKPMIPTQGFKNVTAKKMGYFLFNKNNQNGLRLEKNYFEQAIVVVKENFTDEDFHTFSHRSLLDNMMEGYHMTSDKTFQK